MSVATFGLTWHDVLPELPFDTTSIGTTSTPSSGDLTDYLEDAGSQLAGVLAKAGISLTGLDANTQRQVQDACKAYAAAKAMARIGYAGRERDARQARFDKLLSDFAARPQLLVGGQGSPRTNVDTSSNKTPRTYGANYKW